MTVRRILPHALRLLVALAILLPPATAGAQGVWLSLSFLGGATQPDRDLASYQLDAGGKFAYGLQGMAGSGRWGAGVRMWQWNTTQSTGLLGSDPTVTLRSVQAVGQLHAFSVMGVRTFAFGSIGRVRISYSPDRQVLDIEGAGPIEVRFDPVNEWMFGLGAGATRSIGYGFALGAEVERSSFSLDTVHRNGNQLEENRESFKNWNLRFRLSWELRS